MKTVIGMVCTAAVPLLWYLIQISESKEGKLLIIPMIVCILIALFIFVFEITDNWNNR